MRYTLSVLSAACILALSQPSWAGSLDRALSLRAQTAVMALSEAERADATLLLQTVGVQPAQSPLLRRALPLHPIMVAADQALELHYDSAVISHLPAASTLPSGYAKAPTTDTYQQFYMQLDTDMVRRWAPSQIDAHAPAVEAA